jgi:hypothetical protein
MKLDDLCEAFDVSRFPGILDQAHPDRDAVLDVRSHSRLPLIDDEFLLDCIALELQRIKEDRLQGGLVPFLITRFNTVRLRILATRGDIGTA